LQNIKAFRQELSDENKNDFREFKTLDDMVKHLRGQLDVAKSSKISGLFKTIAAISKYWEPFFEVIRWGIGNPAQKPFFFSESDACPMRTCMPV
jgi:hypothetical protein